MVVDLTRRVLPLESLFSGFYYNSLDEARLIRADAGFLRAM